MSAIIAACFALGVIGQALILVLPKMRKKERVFLWAILGCAALIFLPFPHIPYDIVVRFLGFSGVLILMLSLIFPKYILATIDEGIVLIWTIIAFYLFITVLGIDARVLIAPGIIIFGLIAAQSHHFGPPILIRLFLYLWYLYCMLSVVIIEALHFYTSIYSVEIALQGITWWYAIVLGGLALYLASNAIYLIVFITTAVNKHGSIDDTYHALSVMGIHFNEREYHWTLVAGIGGLVGMGFYLNALNGQIVNHWVIIHIVTVLGPQVASQAHQWREHQTRWRRFVRLFR